MYISRFIFNAVSSSKLVCMSEKYSKRPNMVCKFYFVHKMSVTFRELSADLIFLNQRGKSPRT